MTFKMAKNSLFSTLLRSPWWISALIALLLGLVAMALLPSHLRPAGALSGLPFGVIAGMAFVKQWGLPSAARVEHTQQAVATLSWPAFSQLLQQAFERDGYRVQPGSTEAVDFALERGGRRTLVTARRWKSVRSGLEALRTLQAAREADGAAEAIYVCLTPLSAKAQPFAAEHGITLWQATELATAFKGVAIGDAKAR
jgi:restriction system protein